MKLFRNARRRMAADHRLLAYLRYAFGEIVLVVVGILIALQVNNWNEGRQERAREEHYLANIRNDLTLNVAEIDRYIAARNSRVASANAVLEYYEGKPLGDLDSFNRETVNVYTWQKFFQIDNTFQELTNSGNLAIISNDAVKNGLLDLETLYKKLKYEEEHFRYDSEQMLYAPSYGMLDLHAVIRNLNWQMNGSPEGERPELPRADFDSMLKDRKQKNGFAMATYEFPFMNGQLAEMKDTCLKIIALIDDELAGG